MRPLPVPAHSQLREHGTDFAVLPGAADPELAGLVVRRVDHELLILHVVRRLRLCEPRHSNEYKFRQPAKARSADGSRTCLAQQLHTIKEMRGGGARSEYWRHKRTNAHDVAPVPV